MRSPGSPSVALLAVALDGVQEIEPAVDAVEGPEPGAAVDDRHLRDDRGDARVDRGRVEGDGAAEARAPHGDAARVDVAAAGQPCEGVAAVLDLVEGKELSARLAALRPKLR